MHLYLIFDELTRLALWAVHYGYEQPTSGRFLVRRPDC
jgi:hypothetical protein